MVINLGGTNIYNQAVVHRGNGNSVLTGDDRMKAHDLVLQSAQKTMLKLIISGGDVVTSPGRWLNHMLDCWHIYLICLTVLVVTGFIIYCCVRRKLHGLVEINRDVVDSSAVEMSRLLAASRSHFCHDRQSAEHVTVPQKNDSLDKKLTTFLEV
ncbi:unnamed protein product [Didymodactylos carnosus]|uniref:Uncharacterized protein n=1 Tax=Didymodactylos carnosus TaxID=1234261 RepID=A0A8S2FUX9_9BILA|nr:unnamed protein product [Didymodactylos carnosus]CAF4342898.1 unnamed protein product [Didymodactylos carnosus]